MDVDQLEVDWNYFDSFYKPNSGVYHDAFQPEEYCNITLDTFKRVRDVVMKFDGTGEYETLCREI